MKTDIQDDGPVAWQLMEDRLNAADNRRPQTLQGRYRIARSPKAKSRSEGPWKAAKGYIWRVDRDTWEAKVVNYYGRVVWNDNTGSKGFAGLVRSTARMVAAVRLMDGIGQGKYMVERWDV